MREGKVCLQRTHLDRLRWFLPRCNKEWISHIESHRPVQNNPSLTHTSREKDPCVACDRSLITYTDQFHSGEGFRWKCSTRGRKFYRQFDLTKQIDVAIVDRQIQKNHARPTIEPMIGFETYHLFFGFVTVQVQLCDVTTTTISRDQTAKRWTS